MFQEEPSLIWIMILKKVHFDMDYDFKKAYFDMDRDF